VRGQKGVIDTTRLVRQSPFGEWVNVYYLPDQITEAKLLAHIKANRCPRASRVDGVVNPFAAPGDVVQLKFNAKAETSIKTITLPDGWTLHEKKVGDTLSAGANVLAVSVSRSAAQGDHELKIELANRQIVTGEVAVVKQVGKH
jgi:hypothetical protein